MLKGPFQHLSLNLDTRPLDSESNILSLAQPNVIIINKEGKKESLARNIKHTFVVRLSCKQHKIGSVRLVLLNLKECFVSDVKQL